MESPPTTRHQRLMPGEIICDSVVAMVASPAARLAVSVAWPSLVVQNPPGDLLFQESLPPDRTLPGPRSGERTSCAFPVNSVRSVNSIGGPAVSIARGSRKGVTSVFNSSVLDVAIGLVFIYLLLGLMCTTVNEWIAQ